MNIETTQDVRDVLTILSDAIKKSEIVPEPTIHLAEECDYVKLVIFIYKKDGTK